LITLRLRPAVASRKLLRGTGERSRSRLVLKAHRLLYHSTIGLAVIKKRKKQREEEEEQLPPYHSRAARSNCLLKGVAADVQWFPGGLVF